MISIIIAAKDAERWIQKTIDSVLNQSYKDWECIISVNGSSDKTENISRSIQDKRFRIITNEIPNKSLALNRAIIGSKYDIICVLDSDDLWHPKKIESQLKLMLEKNSNIDILGTQLIYIDENEKELSGSPKLPISNEECVQWLKDRNNPIANSSVMYKKSLHDRIGYYDPEKFAVEDYDMWMRSMRASLKMNNINESFLFHRKYSGSNFNSSNKQAYFKNLIDHTNDVIIRISF